MGDRLGAEVDYCPQCRGIWLQAGRLDQIIERSAGLRAASPATPHAPDPRYEHGHDRDHDHPEHGHRGYDEHGRRKRSFFSDLFD